jgi:thiosulfate dehydrogenase
VSERKKSRRTLWAVAAFTVCAYVASIVIGLKAHNLSLSWWGWWYGTKPSVAWRPPDPASIPDGPVGDSIRSGALLFDETPLYAPANVGGKIACGDCHAAGGIQPFASPMVGMPAIFPMFNARAGHMISLKDRIQECFVRSENGKPIDYDGAIMKNLVAYITWLSAPQPGHRAYKGRGLLKLPNLVPVTDNGKQIYYTQCAGCHGNDGQGRLPMFPAVWGPDSFNDGAGMNTIAKMAPFIQHNMPQNRMGILTPQQAYDVAGFIASQPRPAFNQAYKHF